MYLICAPQSCFSGNCKILVRLFVTEPNPSRLRSCVQGLKVSSYLCAVSDWLVPAVIVVRRELSPDVAAGLCPVSEDLLILSSDATTLFALMIELYVKQLALTAQGNVVDSVAQFCASSRPCV